MRIWTAEKDSKLRGLIRSGMRQKDIFTAMGLKEWTVSQRIKSLGIKKPSVKRGDFDDRIRRLFSEGKKMREIASELDRATGAVCDRISELLLKRPRPLRKDKAL